MKKRESLVVSLSIVIGLFVSAPALAVLDAVVPYMYDDDTGTLHPSLATASVYDGSASPPAGSAYQASTGLKDAAWSTDTDKLIVNAPTDSYWTYNGTSLASADKWTVEFEVKLHDAGTGSDDSAGLAVDLRNGGVGTCIVVGKNYVTLRTGSSTYVKIAGPYEANNVSNAEASGFNRFRMAYDGVDIYVWRDELDGTGWKKIADESTALSARSVSSNVLNFGDFATSASTSALHAEIDYIAFDVTGAYDVVPEPTTMLVIMVASLACLARKRR